MGLGWPWRALCQILPVQLEQPARLGHVCGMISASHKLHSLQLLVQFFHTGPWGPDVNTVLTMLILCSSVLEALNVREAWNPSSNFRAGAQHSRRCKSRGSMHNDQDSTNLYNQIYIYPVVGKRANQLWLSTFLIILGAKEPLRVSQPPDKYIEIMT